MGYVASEEDHGHQAQHQIKTFSRKANTSDPSNLKAVSTSAPLPYLIYSSLFQDKENGTAE